MEKDEKTLETKKCTKKHAKKNKVWVLKTCTIENKRTLWNKYQHPNLLTEGTAMVSVQGSMPKVQIENQ